MWKNFPLFPERASALAGQVDGLYFFLVAVSAFFTLLIFVLIFVFAVKYRRSAHPHPVQIEGSLPLELTWTLIPLGISMIFFAWGSLIYFQEARPPRGAMEVYAVAKQWMWKFEYEGGQHEINQLHVPLGRDVKMIMSSQDAIHSFFVPGLPHQGRRASGPLHVDVVSSDEGGDLPLVLRRILRHGTLRHDRRRGCDGACRLPGVDGAAAELRGRWRPTDSNCSRSWDAPLAIALTRKGAAPTWPACLASRCCWMTAGRSWRTRITFANPS